MNNYSNFVNTHIIHNFKYVHSALEGLRLVCGSTGRREKVYYNQIYFLERSPELL